MRPVADFVCLYIYIYVCASFADRFCLQPASGASLAVLLKVSHNMSLLLQSPDNVSITGICHSVSNGPTPSMFEDVADIFADREGMRCSCQ
jgi:hypothetical protein